MRDMPSNNSLNPTALSLPLMVVCWFNLACRLCRAAGEFQRSAARAGFQRWLTTCRWLTARGSLTVQVRDSLWRSAAALHAPLNAG